MKGLSISVNTLGQIRFTKEPQEEIILTKSVLKEGVRIEFQDYEHPIYSQLYGEFISHLSVIDLLLNHGRESLTI